MNYIGIYCILYSLEWLVKLGEVVKEGFLFVEDCVGFVVDVGVFVMVGNLKIFGLFNLLKGFNNEIEFIVWSEISSCVGIV